jgi:hypothetical protein
MAAEPRTVPVSVVFPRSTVNAMKQAHGEAARSRWILAVIQDRLHSGHAGPHEQALLNGDGSDQDAGRRLPTE